MKTKIHVKELVNKQLLLNYDMFGMPLITFSTLSKGRILIGTKARTGDIGVHVWLPKGDKFKAEVWNYHIKSAYDTTNVNFGLFEGKIPDDAEEDTPLEEYLIDVISYDGQAINPRDGDGFLRLRTVPRALTTYTGNYNHGPNDRNGHIEIINRGDCYPDANIKVSNIGKDNEQVSFLVHMLTLLGDRVTVGYYNNTGFLSASDNEDMFDSYYNDRVPINLVMTGGPTIEEMLREIQEPLDLDKNMREDVYSYLLGFFSDRETYKSYKSGRSYYHTVFNAISGH